MSLQQRVGYDDASGSDAPYEPLAQQPPAEGRPSLELDLEDSEFLSEELLSEEAAVSSDSRVKFIYFILGAAVLLPWNELITASPYFLARLEGSPLRSTFNSYLSTSFTVANFGFLAHATVSSKQSSYASRALWSMFWLGLLSFLLTLSTFVYITPGWFFAFVILNGVAQAAAGSYLQTSVIAMASIFGPTSMQAVMAGQAAVAIAVSGVQVIGTAISVRKSPPTAPLDVSSPEESSALAFFGLSTLFLLFSAAVYVWLTRLPAYRFIMGKFAQVTDTAHRGDDDRVPLNSRSTLLPAESDKRRQVIRVTKANIVYYAAVAYVFVVTLAVFPPITISILPTNPSFHPLVFSAVHFFVFNIGDFLGRYMCSFPRLLIWSARRLFTLSLARTLFIPLFLLCNIQRPSSPTGEFTPIINSDVLYMLILLLFGVSNGYVSSLCMMSVPSVDHNPHLKGRTEDVDVSATVANFFLVGGLVIGSFASFGVGAAVCGCNPFTE